MSFRRTSGCLLVLSLVFSSAYTSNCLAKERAHLDYMLHCQGCHLPDGSGFPNKVPKLNDHVGKFLSVAGGREFLVRVPGSATSSLDSERLAEVLNWLLRTFSDAELPADFKAYTESEVERLRVNPYVNVNTIRAQLIQQMVTTAD